MVKYTASKYIDFPDFYTVPLLDGWEYRAEDSGVLRMWINHPEGGHRRAVSIFLYVVSDPWQPTQQNADEKMREFVTEGLGWEFDADRMTDDENDDGWPISNYLIMQKADQPFGNEPPRGVPLIWSFNIIAGVSGYALALFAINDRQNWEEAWEQSMALAQVFKWKSAEEQAEGVRRMLKEAESDAQ